MPKSEQEISKNLSHLRQRYKSNLSSVAILGPQGSRSPIPTAMMEFGRKIRDTYTQYPTLPGAIHSYQDLASTREWTVSGQPRAAARAVDWLNNAETVNPLTGMVDYGFDQYLRRRVIDYLCMGVTTLACNFGTDTPLEYIDPSRLRFIHETNINTETGLVEKVKPTDRTWLYAQNRQFRAGEVWIHYPIPVGTDGYISPLMHVMPTAMLSWLIRESDTASVDGRRIRDIIFVTNPAIQDSIEEAILTQLALWSGGNPEDIGIPIIAIQGSNQSAKDMFARMGISEIPATFNRQEFDFGYVNEISAAIGLAMRHFYNNDRTTNRALEVVQEQRQQQKGPAAFVRSEQRLINRTGLLKRFGGSVKLPTRFSFVEESDASSFKERAEALKATAEAFGQIFDRLQLSVKPESMVAWLQSTGYLPYDLEFIEAAMAPEGQMIGSDPGTSGNTERAEVSSDPAPTPLQQEDPKSFSEVEEDLGLGEVTINQDGQILAKRSQIFTLNMLLEQELKKTRKAIKELDEISDEEFLKRIQTELEDESRLQFESILSYHDDSLDKWSDDPNFSPLVYKIINKVHILSEDERLLMDRIIVHYDEPE